MGERKFVQTVQVTLPRWPSCSYMVKTFKKSSFPEPKGRCLETWYAASGARVLPICSNPGLTLTCFIWQGQIWSLMLSYGEKGKTMDFSETIDVYDLKQATDDRSDKKFLLISKLCLLGLPAPGVYTCIKS